MLLRVSCSYLREDKENIISIYIYISKLAYVYNNVYVNIKMRNRSLKKYINITKYNKIYIKINYNKNNKPLFSPKRVYKCVNHLIVV